MLFCQFHGQWVPVRERNIKLLLESFSYIAINETVTCILKEKQLCTTKGTTSIVATETPTCINKIKIVAPHIRCRNCHLHVSAAQTSN